MSHIDSRSDTSPSPKPYPVDQKSAQRFADLNPEVQQWISEWNADDVVRYKRHFKLLDDAETIFGFLWLLARLLVGSFISVFTALQLFAWWKGYSSK